MAMHWWVWALVGLILLVVEIVSPGGFYILFFGVGALIVGILTALHLTNELWMQILVFTVSSVLALLLFRKRVISWCKPDHTGKDVDNLVGEAAVALEDIAKGAMGKVELRGASWSAKNGDTDAVSKGQRLKVVEVSGLTLSVVRE